MRTEIPWPDRHAQAWSRREFVGGLTAVGTTGVLVLRQVAADLVPELGRRVRRGLVETYRKED